MKDLLLKSLVILFILGLTQCASKSPEKTFVINPLEEKVVSLESEIKNQSREISQLKAILAQRVQKKKDVAAISPTLGSLIQNRQPESQEEVKKTSTIKLAPSEESNDSPISPLMEGMETIADSSQDAMQTYYRGLQFFNDKKYESAIDLFRSFINENPSHVYADRAQFLIADSYFKNRDFGMVIVATNLLEAKYPYSVKVPEALYRRSIAFVEMNQVPQAKNILSHLMKSFPKDPIAVVARKKWVELNSKNS